MPEDSYLAQTRTAYDTVAADYADLLRDELNRSPFDRAMLSTFTELVLANGGGPVADLGCGPGRITAFLAAQGLDAAGIDLSPAMIAVARRDHPQLRFSEGRLTALAIEDGALAGAVAWYSIIHTPPRILPTVFSEFARVIAPGGLLLLAFQVGDERVHLDSGYGHEFSLDAYRLPPEHIVELASRSSFALVSKLIREAIGREKTPQAYLIFRRAASS